MHTHPHTQTHTKDISSNEEDGTHVIKDREEGKLWKGVEGEEEIVKKKKQVPLAMMLATGNMSSSMEADDARIVRNHHSRRL